MGSGGVTNYVKLLVGAEGNIPVQFSVENRNGLVYTGTTTAISPVTIDLPDSLVVNSATYSDRNNGIRVYANGVGLLSVLAINRQSSASVGEYLAYPCAVLRNLPYEYFIVSTGTKTPSYNSEFLLVGCEDNTTITITPTQPVNIPVDVQSSFSKLITVTNGTNQTFVLHQRQTLIITSQLADLSGTRVVSNKPLTVVSGHQCGNVPAVLLYCEHLSEQIPPTSTWGTYFLLVPFGGRNTGQYFKIISSTNETIITYTCNSTTTQQLLSTAGNSYSFLTSSTSYCSLVTSKPVLVVELGKGHDEDGTGDPIISIVPPIDWYRDSYTFSSLNSTNFNSHFISVSVLPEYYDPASILLDGHPINATWTAIHDDVGAVVGYGCNRAVTEGMTHTVQHNNPKGKMTVIVHGWHSHTGYGYTAALRQNYQYSG